MLNIQLLSDKILVETEEEKTSIGGVLIPQSQDNGAVKTGKVVAVGVGKVNDKGELIDMKVMLGDTVWYQYGSKITVEGKSYILLTESGDVIGIHMAPERN
jgi:chaperonin GroES